MSLEALQHSRWKELGTGTRVKGEETAATIAAFSFEVRSRGLQSKERIYVSIVIPSEREEAQRPTASRGTSRFGEPNSYRGADTPVRAKRPPGATARS